MEKEWSTILFNVLPYKETDTYILKSPDEASQLLDDHIVMTQSMSFSPYKKPFEQRINSWENKLKLTQVGPCCPHILLPILHIDSPLRRLGGGCPLRVEGGVPHPGLWAPPSLAGPSCKGRASRVRLSISETWLPEEVILDVRVGPCVVQCCSWGRAGDTWSWDH